MMISVERENTAAALVAPPVPAVVMWRYLPPPPPHPSQTRPFNTAAEMPLREDSN